MVVYVDKLPVQQEKSHTKTEPDTDERKFLDWIGEQWINNLKAWNK